MCFQQTVSRLATARPTLRGLSAWAGWIPAAPLPAEVWGAGLQQGGLSQGVSSRPAPTGGVSRTLLRPGRVPAESAWCCPSRHYGADTGLPRIARPGQAPSHLDMERRLGSGLPSASCPSEGACASLEGEELSECGLRDPPGVPKVGGSPQPSFFTTWPLALATPNQDALQRSSAQADCHLLASLAP